MPLVFHVLLLFFATGSSGGWTERGKTRDVHIQQGLVRGFVAGWDNPNLRPVEIFLGIPYAAAPVGSLRYMPPQSPQTWGNEDGPVKMASDYAPVCPQILPTIDRDRKKMTQGQANYLKRLVPFLKVQSEDCLTLNIYAPRQDNAYGVVKKSVIVFVHGESFSWNSGNPYDGSVLASYGDVIVVTINFRLGVLGFLQSSSKVSNLGLLDQIAALKWLKDNIIQFGGDPNSVTLMGHHTGAIAVNHLMFSPIIIADPTPRLFQRVILMSGSALAGWSVMKDPERNKRAVAEQLNCDPTDDDSFQECLREKSVGELLNLNFPDEFGPSLGDMVLAREDLKTSPQFKELYSRYDLLCGVTENECYHLLDTVSLHMGMIETDRDRILTEFFNKTFQSYASLIQKRATEFYSKAGLTFRAQPYITARDAVLGILNDVRVINPVMQTALRHTSSSHDAQTFFYVFSHKSSKSEYTGTDQSVHGEELPYIFGVPLGGPSNHFQSNYNFHERLFSEVIMTMWSNFAKTGDPNSPKKYNYLSLSARDWAYFEKLKWPLFEPHNQSYYKFELRPSLGNWYRGEYMEFWNSDLPNYLDRHEKNLKSREENFFFPFTKPRQPYSPAPPPPRQFLPPPSPSQSWPELPVRAFPPDGPYGTVHTHPSSESRDRRPPGSFYKLATIKPRVTEVMEEEVPSGTMDEEQTEKHNGNDHVNSASSFALSVIIVIGLAFIVVNLFLFVFFIRQKRKLCLSSSYPPPFGCGPSPSLPDSNTEPRDEKFEIKSILKSADQLYDAVLKRTSGDEWPEIYRPCSSSTVTIDPHTKVAEWMGQKVKNTNLKQYNYCRNRTDKGSETDIASTATTSKAGEKKLVKKVSVAIDATPSTRSASVLKQIPIELTKSLDSGRYGFGGKVKRDRAISEDDSPLPSHKHSLSDPADFPPTPETPSAERVLKSFNPSPDDEKKKDVNVTSREEELPFVPMSAEEALDHIKKRNFPKVLPDFPDDEPEGAARLAKRLSLPQPAETLKELYKKNPPPPPPRTSTLARKSNRNTVPNSSTTDRDIEDIADNKVKKYDKRQEPRVIIKPTLTDPNLRKNSNSKIPRVTPKHTEKQPPPSPSMPSKHAQVKDPPKKPPGGVGAKLKVHPVKKTSSTETGTTSGTSGSSSSASTVKKGGH